MFLEVSTTNLTENGISYVWDFGGEVTDASGANDLESALTSFEPTVVSWL